MNTAQSTADNVRVADDDADEAVPTRLLDHSYDGIQEFDNPLPSWWSSIFIGSIIFAGFYGLYFHVVGWGATPEENYQKQLTSYDGKRDVRERAELANINEEFLAERVLDAKVVDRGKAVFIERCASCHGPLGAGVIGPNLTDGFQKHGSSRLDIYKTVRGGVPATAMLAWGDQLAPADVVAASAFVITLRHTNIAGKAPEGSPVQPFKK
jgi:cytochrome c oxidase cbb3-type subunit III